MIHVIAMITTRPGRREAVLARFRANVPAVRAERGCIEYAPVVDAPDGGPGQAPLGDDTFMVVEKWATMEDLRAHAASAHMRAYAADVADLLSSRTIHILESAEA